MTVEAVRGAEKVAVVAHRAMPSRWLHALYFLTFFSTSVSQSSLGARNSGVKLHLWRSRFSFDGAGTFLFFGIIHCTSTNTTDLAGKWS